MAIIIIAIIILIIIIIIIIIRLVRFNIQQAIFIDIALIIPFLLGSVLTVVLQQLGLTFPEDLYNITSSLTFIIIITSILYSVFYSLQGIEPDRIPIISERLFTK